MKKFLFIYLFIFVLKSGQHVLVT